MKQHSNCKVCGWPEMEEDPYEMNQMCPSCLFQYGYDDDDQGFTYEQWREKWIKEGMKWRSSGKKEPENWDPKQQLLNIGIRVE